MDTCTHPGEPGAPLFLFYFLVFSDSWCKTRSTETPHLCPTRPNKAQLLLSARFTVDNSSFPL